MIGNNVSKKRPISNERIRVSYTTPASQIVCSLTPTCCLPRRMCQIHRTTPLVLPRAPPFSARKLSGFLCRCERICLRRLHLTLLRRCIFVACSRMLRHISAWRGHRIESKVRPWCAGQRTLFAEGLVSIPRCQRLQVQVCIQLSPSAFPR